MFHLIPRPIHRLILPIAHSVRHRWRRWRKSPIEGCSVVVTDLTDNVLLVRHSYGPPVWGLPGGGLSKGEDPEDAARREVREELGLELGALVSLGVIEEMISGSQHTAHLFSAKSDGSPQPDRREILEAHRRPAVSGALSCWSFRGASRRQDRLVPRRYRA